MNTSLMEQVPKHFMGRVQNTFYFAGTGPAGVLGFLVGAVAKSTWSRDSPSSAWCMPWLSDFQLEDPARYSHPKSARPIADALL